MSEPSPAFKDFLRHLVEGYWKNFIPIETLEKMTYNTAIANRTTPITVEEGHRMLRGLWEIKDWDLAHKLEAQLTEAAYDPKAFKKTYKKFKAGDEFFEGLDDGIVGIWLYGDVDENHWSGNSHILDYGKGYPHGRYGTIVERSEYNSDNLADVEKPLFWFKTSEMLWDKPVPEGRPKVTVPPSPRFDAKAGEWSYDKTPIDLEPYIEDLVSADGIEDVVEQVAHIFRLIQQHFNGSDPAKVFEQSLAAQEDTERFAPDEDHGTFVVEIPTKRTQPQANALTDEQRARRAYLKKKPKFDTTLTEGPKDPKDDR